MKFKKNMKKGFTLVELIVVIAIVAILAAVSVVSYLAFINQANESADIQLVKQLNVALQADESLNGKRSTMHEMLGAMEDNGFVVENLTKTKSGYDIVWDQPNNRFALTKADNSLVYGESTYDSSVKTTKWKFVDTLAEAENKEYSVYLTEEFGKKGVTELSVKSGLDTGNYTGLKEISYSNTDQKTVDIRTNSASTVLTIIAEHDTVNHYGYVGKVDAQKIDMNCYNEYGKAAYIKVTEGKVVAKSGGWIGVVFAANNNPNAVAVIKESQGTIERGLTVIQPVSDTNEARTNGIPLEYSVDGETAADSQFNFDKALEAQEAAVETIAQEAISELRDAELSDTVVRAVTSSTTDYYSFEEFARKVNDGDFDNENNITFTLMANVDLKNEEFTPIGTEEHPFKWIFDGNGYSVKNYKISGNLINHALFGIVRGDFTVFSESQTSLDSYWSDSSKSFNYSLFENSGDFKAIIKNLTVENAYIKETQFKAAAAVVGTAEHAYLENISVKNSKIIGFKGAGGIAGSIGDCVINNCRVDTQTTIYASEYHAAGIAALNNNTSLYKDQRKFANVILHCTNDADVSSLKGNVGGIIGSAQNGSVAVIDCINYGDITVSETGTLNISGLVGGGNGTGSYHQYLIDSVNNGQISGAKSEYISGAISWCAVKAVNVINNGNVKGTPTKAMAGIGAGSVSWSEYIGCVNNGVLTNKNPHSATHDINDNSSVCLVSGEFANTAALNDYLSTLPKEKNFKLECTVADNTGTLVVPNQVEAITSSSKVCSILQLNETRDSNISVQIPQINFEYNGYYTVWFNTPNSNIVVPENVTVPSLSVTGENTTVEIIGTVNGGVTVNNVERVDNHGTIGYISARGQENANIEFNNYGSVGGVDGSAKHSVCTLSRINFTINNHGSIKAGEGNYALLFYGNSTITFNAYATSSITKSNTYSFLAISNGPNTHAKLVTFNVAQGADGATDTSYYGRKSESYTEYECRLIVNLNVNFND